MTPYLRKTFRVYRCNLCGWLSAEFGSRNRINSELLASAHVQLCEHFEKHPGFTSLGNVSVEILSRDDYTYLRIHQGDDVDLD